MESSEIFNSIAYWGYPLMLLLMILEGPITTLVAAFAASFGHFNIFIVLSLSILGDVIGDVILYYIGYFGGERALLKFEKVFKIKESIVCKVRKLFEKKGAKIVFYVKITTGLCYVAFISAGIAKMNIRKFLKYSLYGGLVWSSSLVIVGYFFGYAADQISRYIEYAGYGIFAGAIIFFFVISFFRKKSAKKLIANNDNSSDLQKDNNSAIIK